MNKLIKQQTLLEKIYKYLSIILYSAFILVVVDYFDKQHFWFYGVLILLAIYWLAVFIVLKYNGSLKVVLKYYRQAFEPSDLIVTSVKEFGINFLLDDNRYRQLLQKETVIYKGTYYLVVKPDKIKLYPTEATVVANRISLRHLFSLEITKEKIQKFYCYPLDNEEFVYLAFGQFYHKKNKLVNYLVFSRDDYASFQKILGDKEIKLKTLEDQTLSKDNINQQLDELYELRKNNVLTPDVFYQSSLILQKQLAKLNEEEETLKA